MVLATDGFGLIVGSFVEDALGLGRATDVRWMVTDRLSVMVKIGKD